MPGKQISASASSFNRVNGRGVAAPSVEKLPVLFKTREGLYQSAVCAAVIKAVKQEVEEDTKFFDNSAGKHQQFVTELEMEPEIGTTNNNSGVVQVRDSASAMQNNVSVSLSMSLNEQVEGSSDFEFHPEWSWEENV